MMKSILDVLKLTWPCEFRHQSCTISEIVHSIIIIKQLSANLNDDDDDDDKLFFSSLDSGTFFISIKEIKQTNKQQCLRDC